jgi:uncharacterized integral membrane protein
MRKFLIALIVIPLAVLFVVFAVANRHFATVSFNPFDPSDPALSVSMPLFALIIAVAILGVVAGGCATWIGQRRWRRAARQHQAEAQTARTELANFRATALSARGNGGQGNSLQGNSLQGNSFQGTPLQSNAHAGTSQQRLPAPSQAGQASLYGPYGRDKQGAAL